MRAGSRLRSPLTMLIATAAALLVAVPAGAEPDERSRATEALRAAESVFGVGRGSQAGISSPGPEVDATAALHRLALAYPDLTPAGRARADELLATPSSKGSKRLCATRFCVHWKTKGKHAPSRTDENGNGVPDYVEAVLLSAEYSATVENDFLGWREPRSDGRSGGGKGKVDIYVRQMPPGVFGFASPHVPRGVKRVPRSLSAHLAVDKNFSKRRFKKTTPLAALQVTLAHEYNHVLQYGYDAYQDQWMQEATATYMEELVYPALDDYLRYIGRWSRRSAEPLTAPSTKNYGSAVWNHWLQAKYGPGLVRDAWGGAAKSKPPGLAVNAYGNALKAIGAPGFGDSFLSFAADTAEWRTGQVFPEGGAYRDMVRAGTLRAGGRALFGRLSHTGYVLLDVPPVDVPSITLRVASGRKVPAGIALVGRVGASDSGFYGTVLDRTNKRTGSVTLDNPGAFQRITAVVANTATGALGFDASIRDWVYKGDAVPFKMKVVKGG